MIKTSEEFSRRVLSENGWNEDFVIIEELSELIQAISKTRRFNNDTYRTSLIEELGDCYICLLHLQLSREITDEEINEAINKKMDRYVFVKGASG